MVAQLTISYSLSPPEGTNPPPSLAPISEHAFPVETAQNLATVVGAGASAIGAYYEALRKSIAAAKEKIGEELTAWRDAVGPKAELGKEKVAKEAAARAGEEDEEEEDEDQ